MAARLAMLHRVGRTEAVRQALHRALEREARARSLAERGVPFPRALRATANAARGTAADKGVIDSPCGDS